MAAVQALSAAGLEVVQACDATEALAILVEHPSMRVLVTDVVMPVGTVSGYQPTAMIPAR